MKPVKLKEALKSDYVKSAILLLILVIGFAAFWFGLKLALGTEYPLCGVASGSMRPTLQVGDLIIVQGVKLAEINAAEAPKGDIIVFYRPKGWRDPDDLIVHRAVGIIQEGNISYLETKGDYNIGKDAWKVSEYYLAGKVVGLRIPLVGFITFLMRTPAGILVILPAVILIILDFFFSLREQRES